VNYYEHHIGDYDEATSHLTAVEDGIYSRLLRKYYATEKPLDPDVDQLKRLVRARTREEKSAVDSVLREFFSLGEDGWHQKTCDEVIAEYVAGEPEREQKRVNKDTRLKRHRLIRAAFFEALRTRGQHPAWDMKTEALRELVKSSGLDPETLAAAALATLPDTRTATAPATPATATQSPDTSTQSPVPNPQTPVTGNSVGAADPAQPAGNGQGTQDPGHPAPKRKPPASDADASATRGTRLPKDWALPKAWGMWALGKYPQWTADKVRDEALKFRNHWVGKTGKDATKLEWEATWQNWCMSEIAHRDDPKPATARNVSGPPSQAELDAINAEATRLVLGQPRQEAIDHA
jgi:uncharacterized protein YdaU (DUF1376 family)